MVGAMKFKTDYPQKDLEAILTELDQKAWIPEMVKAALQTAYQTGWKNGFADGETAHCQEQKERAHAELYGDGG